MSSNNQVDCAVVIVTYNSASDIVGLLDSLPAAADGVAVRVVVVDNGSADGTPQVVRDRNVVCVEAGGNLGYAAGINIGREHAGDYSALLVLNPDLVLEPGAIRKMFAALDDPDVGIIVPLLLDAAGQRTSSLRRYPTPLRAIGDGLLGDHLAWRPAWLSEMVLRKADYTFRHPVDWATGAAMLISAACDRTVGPWDEQFFLYSEEVDYAARAKAAGYRIDFLPTASARHRGGGSGQSSALTALIAVNRIRYMEKSGRWYRTFRAAVVLAELVRSASPEHRRALRAVLDRSSWAELPAGERAQSIVTPVGEA